ncbi:MAG: phosphatase PAP2 family protein, partial [Paracoccaceae bacterium]
LNRPTRAVFEQQLPMVRAYGDLRGDRLTEILLQTEDLVSFFGAQGYLSANRNRHTMAALYTALRAAVHIEMPIKHFCRSARPIDFAPMVQPMIQTPDHSSFPSGHAIEVFAAATVFARLVTGLGPKEAMTNADNNGRMGTLAFKLALRIASNRSVAGVHFPIDSASGAIIGCSLGEALYRIACGNDDFPPLVNVEFDLVPEAAAPFDLTLPWLKSKLPDDAPGHLSAADDTIFGKLWDEADNEWNEI